MTIILWIVLILSISSPAIAETVVTLKEACQSALSKSERIAIAQEETIQAEEAKRAARSYLYPKIEMEASLLRRTDSLSSAFGLQLPASETRWNLTITQPLYTGGRATATYKIAEKRVTEQTLLVQATKEGLLFQIVRAYYDALKAKKNLEIEAQDHNRLEAHLNVVENKFKVGEIAKPQLLLAKAALSNVKGRVVRAKADLILTKNRLASLAKMDLPFEITEPPPFIIAEQSETEWIANAREHRSDYKMNRLEQEIAQNEIAFAKGGFYPAIALEGSYHGTRQDTKTPFLIPADTTAMLKMTVPLFEGFLRGAEESKARSRYHQTVLMEAVKNEELVLEVKAAWVNLSSLTSSLEYLNDQIVSAKENNHLVSRQFATGLATALDVLDADVVLMNAERQIAFAAYDREMAIFELLKASGRFLISMEEAHQ